MISSIEKDKDYEQAILVQRSYHCRLDMSGMDH